MRIHNNQIKYHDININKISQNTILFFADKNLIDRDGDFNQSFNADLMN